MKFGRRQRSLDSLDVLPRDTGQNLSIDVSLREDGVCRFFEGRGCTGVVGEGTMTGLVLP